MTNTITEPKNKGKFEKIKNVPYPLPEGWKWVKLDEIVKDLESGKRPKGGAVNSGIPSIGGEHLNSSGGFNFDSLRFIPEDFYKKMKKGKIQKSDILIVKDGATTGKVAYVGENFPFKEAAVNEHIFILRVENNTYSKYIFWILYSPLGQKEILKNFGGAAQGGINRTFIKNVKISIPVKNGKPDLEKQKQIVKKIETIFKEIDKAIALRQKALEDTKKLFESVLNKIFKEAEEDKDNWKWVVLKNIFTNTISGDWGKENEMEDFKEKMHIIRGTDFKNIEINKLENIPVRYIKSTKSEKIFLKEGDLIIEISGGSKDQPTGRIAIIPNIANNKRIGFSNFVRKLVFNKDIFYPKYLYYQWKFLYFHGITVKYEKASTNIRNFKYKLFLENEKIPIPIKNNQPDLEKQKEIAEYLDNLHNKIKQLEDIQKLQLEKFKQLKESILNKAFRGELV